MWTMDSVGGRDAEREGTNTFRRYGIASINGPELGRPSAEGCVA